ncbi:PleD family two-component system response regulator [Consotaella salsifontis]|uniref:diguanylate cyclase n=1 Tax=Consotaella salsifontis TaxID=1365950 RepID=A0A1T4LNJ3_9HYPH|nr:PleD family two-component system response regulator [Consotaella salsifontis]SJZ56233.1 response regulator receiver modulated diguanylate cyclase [Consotaella salsifontis]
MTGRILIVDDIEVNLRLLEARLSAEYFDVVRATSGAEAIEICRTQAIDLVLLDVMMPGMDGYEVCRRLKGDFKTMHLPIVLITALDQPSDRLMGLEAGADDFLTKPVSDLQLFSRVKSLTRQKLLTDELRIRAETTVDLVVRSDLVEQLRSSGLDGRLLIVDEDAKAAERLARTVRGQHSGTVAASAPAAFAEAARIKPELLIINLSAQSFDGLRLVSQLRAGESTRSIPILLIGERHDEARIARGLDLGANDYLLRPVDANELLARTRTQIRHKRYADGLRQSLTETIELAVRDPLTGLHNRRFMENQLEKAMERSRRDGRPLAVLIADIDHFKRINDEWGHDVGDFVLKHFATTITAALRGSDLACRYGGEEFVVLMPEADARVARLIGERLRISVAENPIDLSGQRVNLTVSAGYSVYDPTRDTSATLLKRADAALYLAKKNGRNQVMAEAA